jgi:hypothetical protein
MILYIVVFRRNEKSLFMLNLESMDTIYNCSTSFMVFRYKVASSSLVWDPQLHKGLIEIARNCVYSPPECVVDKFERLVMTYNMKEHSNLFFQSGVNAIIYALPKRLDKLIEGDHFIRSQSSLPKPKVSDVFVPEPLLESCEPQPGRHATNHARMELISPTSPLSLLQ